jgi:hypothetical protein
MANNEICKVMASNSACFESQKKSFTDFLLRKRIQEYGQLAPCQNVLGAG